MSRVGSTQIRENYIQIELFMSRVGSIQIKKITLKNLNPTLEQV